jgi:hypothetical protein
VELLGEDEKPLPGFSLADCDELFGDSIDRIVTWADRSDVSAYAGRSIRLRIVMRDADLYALQFTE